MRIADLHEGEFALRGFGCGRVPINPTLRGTPPLIAHTTPVPAQAMHFNRPRRFTPGLVGVSLSECLLMLFLLYRICPTGMETGRRLPVIHGGGKNIRSAVRLRDLLAADRAQFGPRSRSRRHFSKRLSFRRFRGKNRDRRKPPSATARQTSQAARTSRMPSDAGGSIIVHICLGLRSIWQQLHGGREFSRAGGSGAR